MSQGQMMTPQERRIFVQQGTTAAAIGAVNTAVALFAGAAAALAIGGGTSLYPLASWVTVTNDANAGTTYKFTRKGIYHFHVVLPGTAGDGGDFAAAVGLEPAFLQSRRVDNTLVLTLEGDPDAGWRLLAWGDEPITHG